MHTIFAQHLFPFAGSAELQAVAPLPVIVAALLLETAVALRAASWVRRQWWPVDFKFPAGDRWTFLESGTLTHGRAVRTLIDRTRSKLQRQLAAFALANLPRPASRLP